MTTSPLRPRTLRRVLSVQAPAFTLLELMVSIAILILLIAILLPSLSYAREASRRVMCAGNLRQWGIALQLYRDEHNDFLPTEGTYLDLGKDYTWYTVLPPYLDLPPYLEYEGANENMQEFPNVHLWICPSKNLSDLFESTSGQNVFHYGINEVLDGVGDGTGGTLPDFPDMGEDPISAQYYLNKPYSVYMFDIYPNSPHGDQRDVAAGFHRDFANVLYVNGGVANFRAKDFVVNGDFEHGAVIWNHPKLYWGYPRKR